MQKTKKKLPSDKISDWVHFHLHNHLNSLTLLNTLRKLHILSLLGNRMFLILQLLSFFLHRKLQMKEKDLGVGFYIKSTLSGQVEQGFGVAHKCRYAKWCLCLQTVFLVRLWAIVALWVASINFLNT